MALKNKNKKDTKIDELALITKRGFDAVDERFDKVDERFDAVDERFGKIDERFDKIDEKFDAVDERFNKVDEKFDKLEKVNAREHEAINEKLSKHDNRLTALEIAVKFGFDESKKRDEKLEAKIDKSITLLDGYVNKQESFKRDFTVMKEEMRQVKGVIKNKLGVEIKAV